jgi:dolichyl-phosphate-mannose--protein O-mannosyl transferase
MSSFLNKKIFLLPFGILLFQYLVLPLKSFALDYVPLEGKAFEGFKTPGATGQLNTFLVQVFQFGLAIAAALAVIMIVWGGVEIMISESPFGKSSGKDRIWNAIWGLLLALVSYLILYTINPDILIFKL